MLSVVFALGFCFLLVLSPRCFVCASCLLILCFLCVLRIRCVLLAVAVFVVFRRFFKFWCFLRYLRFRRFSFAFAFFVFASFSPFFICFSLIYNPPDKAKKIPAVRPQLDCPISKVKRPGTYKNQVFGVK